MWGIMEYHRTPRALTHTRTPARTHTLKPETISDPRTLDHAISVSCHLAGSAVRMNDFEACMYEAERYVCFFQCARMTTGHFWTLLLIST